MQQPISVAQLAFDSPDVLYSICSAAFTAALPPSVSSLDPPFAPSEDKYPTGCPSSYPSPNWPEPLARKTLASLCLVNKACHNAAQPWLYRKVEVRMPLNWLNFVDEITGGEEDGEPEPPVALVDQTVKNAASLLGNKGDPLRIQECVMESLEAGIPVESIPLELLTPPLSREPSPQRLRAKSPGRWRLIRSITDAVENVTGMYVPTPSDHRPGRHTRSLDFNHFRTIGMRRSVGEGMQNRYVTGGRLERVLKEMVNLQSFGATEYMDGALTFPVLCELLLRGRTSRDRGRARPRSPSENEVPDHRKECRPIEALDFCGCISSVFVKALGEFVQTYLRTDDEDAMEFTELQRLGLRSVRSIPESVLKPFVLAFPSLTHLDLSGTLCSPDLLEKLAHQPGLRLTSLALGRCSRLTSESISELLVDGPATSQLKELSLYGDELFGSHLTEMDLMRIVTKAPCFTSGQLRYLDLSSSPVTSEILKTFHSQPVLRSLGLSHIPNLPLSDIADFLLKKAPNVEVLTIIKTSPELTASTTRSATLALHSKITQPLATPPFTFSLTGPVTPKPAATRLRILELSQSILKSLEGGVSGSWRVIKSKGGRGWYVDTGCGWIAEGEGGGELKRDLPINHCLRVEFNKLADANGNVNSGIGWHARKMEILCGDGMLGREDGLYGAVSFAYTG
ncbi:hypothetical protein M422DRAFT_26181 [Sphaerobolus stellatus SS14]|nr:hypothetical protein M422DRAFT_26181 [Sphaerobolus stellatus SS14]